MAPFELLNLAIFTTLSLFNLLAVLAPRLLSRSVTDGHTDWTDILRQPSPRYAYASRGKKT